jgi:hypothetical protein
MQLLKLHLRFLFLLETLFSKIRKTQMRELISRYATSFGKLSVFLKWLVVGEIALSYFLPIAGVAILLVLQKMHKDLVYKYSAALGIIVAVVSYCIEFVVFVISST